MGEIFHAVIYQPLYNIVIFFYAGLPIQDFGLAIILTTVLIKLAFFSLSRMQIEQQKRMQEIQPKLKVIQEKYKDDKAEQTKAIMACYKENKVNPFAGCLPLIIQLVFFITFYRVIININANGLVVNGADMYGFVTNPGEIKHLAFGFLDMVAASPVLGALAALAQYFQTKMILPQAGPIKKKDGTIKDEMPDMAAIMGKQMLYIGPALVFFFSFQFPAALSLYWFVSTLLAWGQQKWIFSQQKPVAAPSK
ncbi:MAG: YidC/Oxa1 family membrane protein insertase [Candidatus Moraniibacteriota bacterium]|nr:MAG: YidC/Oxa1 family membrane protein insertase [Candidatus Moranbacteria bacterium]